MKAYCHMHLLVPRSRSSAKVKVKCKGYISQKMAFMFHKQILGFFFYSCKCCLKTTVLPMKIDHAYKGLHTHLVSPVIGLT